jgi:hypothetical protein
MRGKSKIPAIWRRVFPAVFFLFAGGGSFVHAAILYLEDFSDTSEWFPVYNPNGGVASVTSDGSQGSFFMADPNEVVAFAPVFPLVSVGIFNPAATYLFSFEVVSISYSTSYSIEIDLFDENQAYLSTIFNVVPEGTFVGFSSVSFDGSGFDPGTRYILPKVTMRTGDGNQTIVFDHMSIEQLPEPSAVMMMLLGGCFFVRLRLKKFWNNHG